MSMELPMPKSEPVSSEESLLAGLRPKTPLVGLIKALGQYLGVAALALASYLLISHFFLQSVRVVGVSMVPTLQNTQRYLLNRWVFHVRKPHRNDIVVLRDPQDNELAVKRVIATEGDNILLKRGQVYLNGQLLAEPYLPAGTPTFPYSNRNTQRFTCGPGEYFVLGDNRNNSVDSRTYGPVPRQNILGLVVH